jgi:hypothetical protein
MARIARIHTRRRDTKITFKNGKTALIKYDKPYTAAMVANALNAFALNESVSFSKDGKDYLLGLTCTSTRQ